MSEDDLDLSAWQVPPPPDGLADGILARVDGTQVNAVAAREVPSAPRRRWGAMLAAGIGGAGIAAAIAFALTRGGSTPAVTVEPGALVAAAPSTVAIAPGTTATVSTGAALSWRLDDHGALHVTQTSGAVTYQHSPGRHLVVHAGTARVEADAAQLHVEVPMSASKNLRAGTIGAALATVVVVAVYQGRAALSTTTGQVALDAGAVGVAPEADPPTLVASATPRRALPTAPRRFGSPADRSAMLDELAKSRARRELRDRIDAVNHAAGSTASVDDAAGLDPDDVRASVKEVLPLMAECFGQASAATQTAGGELVVKLSLITEPDVGTVIAEADLTEGDAALITDTGLTECLHETLMSLELPPLPDGGTGEIRYPFAFSSDGPPDEADEPPPVSPKPLNHANPIEPRDEKQADEQASTPAKTVRELIDEANDAARSGQYALAIKRAEAALKQEPDNMQALTTAAIAACNLKDAARASRYVPKLSAARRGMVVQVCKRNGIELDDSGELKPSPY